MHRPEPHTTTALPFDAHALVAAIAWLRPCAALGQALAIAAALVWLHITLPLLPLAVGIALLLASAPLLFWRLRRGWPVTAAEAAGHLIVDVILLSWALFFTGGASNPFITLLLVPVALAAAALPGKAIAAVTALAVGAYALLIFRYVPLADMPMHGNAFRLHLTGMTINFMIAVLLLAVFVGRIAASLTRQREATRRLRERTLRDEGILAIATQAADAAHRLNTPLSTLRTLLTELAGDPRLDAARTDLDLMAGEVERCRGILRDMVDYGRQQLDGHPYATTAGDFVRASADRFRLLRPDAELAVTVERALDGRALAVEPALAHALFNLLQNAFDASHRNGSRTVTLDATLRGDRFECIIGDRGDGFPGAPPAGLPAQSGKPGGLGIGLALARTTIERLRGELSTTSSTAGTRVRVQLPLGATS